MTDQTRARSLARTTDSFLFLFLSMIIIAASLYLPQHITNVASRAWFYYAGDEAVGMDMDTDTGELR